MRKSSLPIVLDDLNKFEGNIIVSLKSNDYDTLNSIKNYNVQIHEQNGDGYGNALIEAINICKTNYFCIFNADGSFDKNDLEKMYTKIKEDDFIFTSRYIENGGSEDDTFVTWIGNQIFSLMTKLLFSLNLSDILYTYLMGKTKSFKKLDIVSYDFRFCVEFPIKMCVSKMKYSSIPSKEKKRIGGEKKVNALKDGFLILCEILILFFRYKIFRQKIITQ